MKVGQAGIWMAATLGALATCGAWAATVPKRRPMPPLRGVAIHFCSCSAPCPCMFSEDGDMEGCTLVSVYHFTDGGYEGAWMKGRTLVRAMLPENREVKGKPVMVEYVPADLTKDQQLTLVSAVEERAWGAGPRVPRTVPIQFRAVNGGYEVSIPGIFRARTVPIRGVDQKQLVVENVDFAEGNRWRLGRAEEHSYREPATGWEWNYPRSNGAWCNFTWGPHVDPLEEAERKLKARKTGARPRRPVRK